MALTYFHETDTMGLKVVKWVDISSVQTSSLTSYGTECCSMKLDHLAMKEGGLVIRTDLTSDMS